METIELHLRSFMMKLISLDGALGDIEDVEGEKKKGKERGVCSLDAYSENLAGQI